MHVLDLRYLIKHEYSHRYESSFNLNQKWEVVWLGAILWIGSMEFSSHRNLHQTFQLVTATFISGMTTRVCVGC